MKISDKLMKDVERDTNTITRYSKKIDELDKKKEEYVGFIKKLEDRIFTAMNNLTK